MKDNDLVLFEKVNLLDQKNWVEIINDPKQIALLSQAKDLLNSELTTLEAYETAQAELSLIQRQVNAYNTKFVAPIKKFLNDFKNNVVLQQEKKTVEFLKQAKKDLKIKAIAKGLIFDLPKTEVLEIQAEKQPVYDDLYFARQKVETELDWLKNNPDQTRSNEYLQGCFNQLKILLSEPLGGKNNG